MVPDCAFVKLLLFIFGNFFSFFLKTRTFASSRNNDPEMRFFLVFRIWENRLDPANSTTLPIWYSFVCFFCILSAPSLAGVPGTLKHLSSLNNSWLITRQSPQCDHFLCETCVSDDASTTIKFLLLEKRCETLYGMFSGQGDYIVARSAPKTEEFFWCKYRSIRAWFQSNKLLSVQFRANSSIYPILVAYDPLIWYPPKHLQRKQCQDVRDSWAWSLSATSAYWYHPYHPYHHILSCLSHRRKWNCAC